MPCENGANEKAPAANKETCSTDGPLVRRHLRQAHLGTVLPTTSARHLKRRSNNSR
jgi:hypothetical protein